MKLLLTSVTVTLVLSNIQLTKGNYGKNNKTSVEIAFYKAGFVPKVISTAPKKLLEIRFENAVVHLGNEIYPTDTTNVVAVNFDFERDCPYLFISLVLDAPYPKKPYLSPYIQTLYVNVLNLRFEKSCEVVTYIPANPMAGGGRRRYLLLTYKQECIINATDPYLTRLQSHRLAFPVAAFLEKYKLCEPAAGNFYVSQFPDESYCQIDC